MCNMEIQVIVREVLLFLKKFSQTNAQVLKISLSLEWVCSQLVSRKEGCGGGGYFMGYEALVGKIGDPTTWIVKHSSLILFYILYFFANLINGQQESLETP